MKTKVYLIAAITSLALLAGAFGYGVHKGTVWQVQKFEADRQNLQEEILDLNVSLQDRAAEIERLQAERQELIHDLEQAALDAVGAGNPGVAATGGLQRLENRWGPSPTSSK